MLKIVLIIIAGFLGGYTLNELNSMTDAVGGETLMAVRRAQTVLSADCGGLSSVALAVMRMGRSPPWTSSAENILRIGTDRDETVPWESARVGSY